MALEKREPSRCDTIWKGLFLEEYRIGPGDEEKVKEYIAMEETVRITA